MKKSIKALLNLLLVSGITLYGITEKQSFLITHVKKSIEMASLEQSNIDKTFLTAEGMSSPKVRHFLNNVCNLTQANYLEIGVWKGSTFMAALSNNTSLNSATAIDNWAEFGGPRDAFYGQIAKLNNSKLVTIYEKDAFQVDIKTAFKKKIDIYFYDGEHTFDAQKSAFTYYKDILADTFIAIVDDYNHPPAKA